MDEQAVVRCVDRLVVRVDSPDSLFNAFTQNLLLPRAWSVSTNPFFTSGGIHLSNMNLEILQVGQPRRAAELFGIAFQLAPYDISLPELENRGIPHTPPMPFFVVDDQGWQVTAWTNVYLGGLLGTNPMGRLFFSLSHRTPQAAWENASLPRAFNRRVGLPFIYDTVYQNGITFAVDYNPAWRSANIAQEPTRVGLDVQRVYEITIGTRDYQNSHTNWKALLDPHKEVAPGVWKLPKGTYIRLVRSAQDGLRRMVWQVTSLNRAVQFLHKREMLGKEKDGMPTIDEQKVEGLDIRLVQ